MLSTSSLDNFQSISQSFPRLIEEEIGWFSIIIVVVVVNVVHDLMSAARDEN